MTIMNNKVICSESEMTALAMNIIRAYNRKFANQIENYQTSHTFVLSELESRDNIKSFPLAAKERIALYILELIIKESE